MSNIIFRTRFARQYPDPDPTLGKNIRHYLLLCMADSIPSGIPLDSNPRGQNINRSIYKDVAESLVSHPPHTFHLKNKGITMLAENVQLDEKKSCAEVEFKQGQGIVDGGHTYKIIRKVIESEENSSKGQYVKIEILTGVPDEYISEIAEGLNTSVQVSPESLENLREHFGWIKEELKGEPYENLIAYHENAKSEDGESDPSVSIRDVIAWLRMFLPDENGRPTKEHPKVAYTQKAKCLEDFQKNKERYQEMRPILKDILQLRDHIQLNAIKKYNEPGGRKGKKLAFIQKRVRGEYYLEFSGKSTKERLHAGALYPMWGAFRYLVTKKSNGEIGWKPGNFNKVLQVCDDVLARMMEKTKNSCNELSRNINAMGKSDVHWDAIYDAVALQWLEQSKD